MKLEVLTEEQIDDACAMIASCKWDCEECQLTMQRDADLISAEKQKAEAVKAERERVLILVEDMLDLHDDESGWIRISNHVDYAQWQSLKEGKE